MIFLEKECFFTKKRAVILIVAVIFAATALGALITKGLIDNKFVNEAAKRYTLKTYGDFLALYNGEKLEEIYEEIVISSLPPLDREKFLNGVTVTDIEKLDEILEDFE